ncbi:hypothetical protein DOTSEDRAFT_70461 [Dothistroma septosporum NZE10]|uniref:Uncharacterized protein n=1 Tax=Dothistroma septosporum (strain NZE10 / CBS 128990) TaxID=675120 RepID=N1PVS7_DOTSN|nr:hypothetical protein DOTSEDRAFT_70461 [Dothistroma septosporum NZE10]
MAPSTRTGDESSGGSPKKRAPKKKDILLQGSLPRIGPSKTPRVPRPVRQMAEKKAAQNKALNEAKTRRFKRNDRKRKRKNHLEEGLLDPKQQNTARDISDAVNTIDKLFRDDSELYGNLRVQLTPFFDTLRKLGVRNPTEHRKIARSLYKASYVETGDTDVETDDQDPQVVSGPRRKPIRKVSSSGSEDNDDVGEDDSSSESGGDDEKKPKRKPRKPSPSTVDHNPSGGNKRKVSPSADNDGAVDDGPIAKRTRSSTSPPPRDSKSVEPKEGAIPRTKADLARIKIGNKTRETDFDRLGGASSAGVSKSGPSAGKTPPADTASIVAKQSRSRSIKAHARANAEPVDRRTGGRRRRSKDEQQEKSPAKIPNSKQK